MGLVASDLHLKCGPVGRSSTAERMEGLPGGFGGRGGDGWAGRASKPFLARMQAIELSLRGHIWPIAAILLTCWIAAHGGKLGARSLMDAQFDSKRFPVGAVNYLEKQNLQWPLLSTDSWGGDLIFRLYPRIRLVIDDRHDFYGEEFLKCYLQIVRLDPEWHD